MYALAIIDQLYNNRFHSNMNTRSKLIDKSVKQLASKPKQKSKEELKKQKNKGKKESVKKSKKKKAEEVEEEQDDEVLQEVPEVEIPFAEEIKPFNSKEEDINSLELWIRIDEKMNLLTRDNRPKFGCWPDTARAGDLVLISGNKLHVKTCWRMPFEGKFDLVFTRFVQTSDSPDVVDAEIIDSLKDIEYPSCFAISFREEAIQTENGGVFKYRLEHYHGDLYLTDVWYVAPRVDSNDGGMVWKGMREAVFALRSQ